MGDKGNRKQKDTFPGIDQAFPPNEAEARGPNFEEIIGLRMTLLGLLQQLEEQPTRVRLSGKTTSDLGIIIQLVGTQPIFAKQPSGKEIRITKANREDELREYFTGLFQAADQGL